MNQEGPAPEDSEGWLREAEELEKKLKRARLVRRVLSALSVLLGLAYLANGCAGEVDCHERGGVYVRESIISSACAERLR